MDGTSHDDTAQSVDTPPDTKQDSHSNTHVDTNTLKTHILTSRDMRCRWSTPVRALSALKTL